MDESFKDNCVGLLSSKMSSVFRNFFVCFVLLSIQRHHLTLSILKVSCSFESPLNDRLDSTEENQLPSRTKKNPSAF
ncbi:hypothetical protein Gasu2_13090 [Galdieria sulphuraria]|nr:hypothetical protein Gasu2_13090 [Galdieria sulphuraria]